MSRSADKPKIIKENTQLNRQVSKPDLLLNETRLIPKFQRRVVPALESYFSRPAPSEPVATECE